MKYLYHFINPINWWRAYRFKKSNDKYDKSSYDLELNLYSKLLKNDMLHYGYFKNPNINTEDISLKQIEDAQILYSHQIIDKIKRKEEYILDVGCGMGGLAKIIKEKNLKVEVLTPNKNQIDHIQFKYPELKFYHSKFENLKTSMSYGTIIHSESLQYMDLDKAFKKVELIMNTGGQWIITDYFRIDSSGINKSGHQLDDFLEKVEEYRWETVFKQDITGNVMPTLKFINMYAERFLFPLKHFAFEKLRFKNPKLFFMTKSFRDSIDKKIHKEMASVDARKFENEKKYLLFVLEKKFN